MFPKTTLSITDKPSVLLILEIATPQRIHFNIKASSFRIDWGDEVIDTNDSHNYIRAGKYSVKIFSDKLLQLKCTECNCIEAYVHGCRHLQRLECDHNPMDILSVSECNNLMILGCACCRIASLELKNLSSLRWLNCSSNILTKLHLSGLYNLIILDAGNNMLEEMDIEGCDSIVSVNIENNEFSASQLTEIFDRLVANPPESNAYIFFAGNPGDSCCNTSVLEVKNWKVGQISEAVAIFEKDQEKDQSLHSELFLESLGKESIVRLVVSIKEATKVFIYSSADSVLYVWTPSDTSTSKSSSRTFVPSGEKTVKEIFIFAENLKNLVIEDVPCIDIDIQSPTLEALKLNQTQLKRLDLSGTPALQLLYCFATPLKSLDLSVCKTLNMATCSNGQLKTLKVAGLDNMQYLDCSGNKLGNLDLTGCSHLRTINISRNNFSKLDISDCIELHFLHCDYNCFSDFESLFRQLPMRDDDIRVFNEKNNEIYLGSISFLGNPATKNADRDILTERFWHESELTDGI